MQITERQLVILWYLIINFGWERILRWVRGCAGHARAHEVIYYL